jgi:hypothetical protein
MGHSRRWVIAAAVAGTAVAVLGPVAIAAGAAGQESGAARPAAGPGGAPSASAPADPATEPAARRLGAVVDAGFAAKEGAWVFYAVSVDIEAVPGTRFGVMAGRRLADGTIADVVLANEVEGADRAPGFHAGQAGMVVDGEQSPSFGYYVGAAAKITARAGGRTVTARQAAWSEDAAVRFFWFDPRAGAVSDLRAYDSAGRRLPAGQDRVAVG